MISKLRTSLFAVLFGVLFLGASSGVAAGAVPLSATDPAHSATFRGAEFHSATFENATFQGVTFQNTAFQNAATQNTAALGGVAPAPAQQTTAPPGPVLNPEDTERADSQTSKNKLVVGVVAAVLAVIVFLGRRARNKHQKAADAQQKGK